MKYKKIDIEKMGSWVPISDFTSVYKRPVYQVTQGKIIFNGKKSGKSLVIYLEEPVEIQLSPVFLIRAILVIENKVYYLPYSELESLKVCYGQFIGIKDTSLFFMIPGMTIGHFKLVDPFRECSY